MNDLSDGRVDPIALVDVNSFCVSCERAFDLPLQGPPIVVVLSNNDDCVVSPGPTRPRPWASKTVTLGSSMSPMPNEPAGAPESNYELYGDLSSRVMELLGRFAHIQEMYFQLPKRCCCSFPRRVGPTRDPESPVSPLACLSAWTSFIGKWTCSVDTSHRWEPPVREGAEDSVLDPRPAGSSAQAVEKMANDLDLLSISITRSVSAVSRHVLGLPPASHRRQRQQSHQPGYRRGFDLHR